jgi:hypothetical protein
VTQDHEETGAEMIDRVLNGASFAQTQDVSRDSDDKDISCTAVYDQFHRHPGIGTLQHAGDRCRPSGDVTDLLSRLILGCRDALDTKRALPSINILVASSGEMLTDEAIPGNGKGWGFHCSRASLPIAGHSSFRAWYAS